jgi:hypothetical protein
MALDSRHDGKRVQSFIQGLLDCINALETTNTSMQSLRDAWIAKAPAITDHPITGSQATQANNMIQAFNTFVNSDWSGVITMLKLYDMSSHPSGMLFED